MKVTINMDDALLDSVVEITGASTKTEAIHIALREIVRKAELLKALNKGSGLSAEDLADAIDPAYDLMKMRLGEVPEPFQVVSLTSIEP